MLLKKIDRYIIKKFFGSFFFVLFIIMSLSVIFDLSENYREIKSANMSALEVFSTYYIYFIIHFSHLFANLLMFITVIFFTSKLAGDSEIIAFMSNGVSFNRLLRPYLISASILFSLTMYSNHFILPVANEKKFDFESTHIRKTKKHYNNVYKEFTKNSYVNLEWFNFETQTAEKMRLQYFSADRKMAKEINSKYAVFDPEKESWTLHNAVIRTYIDTSLTNHNPAAVLELAQNPMIEEKKEVEVKMDFSTKDIIQTAELAANLKTPVLKAFLVSEKEKGNERINLFELEYYRRTSFPFSVFILMIIAVLFSAQKSRNSSDLGLNLAVGLLIAVSYIFIMQVSTVAVTNVKFNPLIAAWLPNLIFIPIACWAYFKKR